MVLVERSALVGFSAERMYTLVENIEAYPEFLPWCSRTEVTLREDTRTAATMHINYRGIREKFSTENTNEPGRLIAMRLVSGPFRHLQGHWCFTPLGEQACKVEFRLEYEISSRLLARVLGPVFQHIANTFVDAFVERAQQTLTGQ
jgi:ribosome-associated toxin RatA of RatAB toxin-antitoxin module